MRPDAEASLEGIRAAAERIRGVAVRTPTVLDAALSRRVGPVHLKLESLQATGSFKIRGAFNRCASLSEDERTRGVICASAGNHGLGVAYSARHLGVPATVVTPTKAPFTKVRAIGAQGAEIVLHGESYDDAYEHAQALCEARGLTYIHAYDDPLVIAGQGTIGLEVLEALPDLGTIVVPIGGGGLISGIATSVKALRPEARVVGVVSSASPGALRSFERKERVHVPTSYTIADGIRVKMPGGLTFPIIQALVDAVCEVTDEEIGDAIFHLLEAVNVVAEGAGAAALAAVLTGKVELAGPCCVVVSGGNLDLNLLNHIVERGLSQAGTYFSFSTRVPDRPGQLNRLLHILAEKDLNILDVAHHRAGVKHPLGVVEIEVTAEARGPGQGASVVDELRGLGYEVRLLSGG